MTHNAENFMKKLITFLAFLTCSLPSWSFTPESGFWWNPNEPGTGYSIEIQDNFLFGAFYVYDTGGIPYWYTTSGFLDGNASFTGDFYVSEDGQCLGCSWSPANSFPASEGELTITFLTETTATIEFLGQIKSIQRHNFFLGDELQKMRGEWQMVLDRSQMESGYPFIADVLIFEQTETFEGIDLATGCRSESTVFYNNCTDDALFFNSAAASVIDDRMLIVVDDSDSHYLSYVVNLDDLGTDQFDGVAHSYRKSSNFDPLFTNEPGYTVRSFRSASKTFVDTGTGPSKTAKSQLTGPISLDLPSSSTASNAEVTAASKAFNAVRVKLERFLEQKKQKAKVQ